MYNGGFHLHLLEFPFVCQFYSRTVDNSKVSFTHCCRECNVNPQIFGTPPFAPADFEASSTMCTRCFETHSSPGCTCTRRSKLLTHSLSYKNFTTGLTLLVKVGSFSGKRLPYSRLLNSQRAGKGDLQYTILHQFDEFYKTEF